MGKNFWWQKSGNFVLVLEVRTLLTYQWRGNQNSTSLRLLTEIQSFSTHNSTQKLKKYGHQILIRKFMVKIYAFWLKKRIFYSFVKKWQIREILIVYNFWSGAPKCITEGSFSNVLPSDWTIYTIWNFVHSLLTTYTN